MGRTLQRYKKLFETLKTDTPHKFYLLYGPEEFLKKEFISELIETRLSGGNRAFNLDIFHGDDFDRDVFNDRMSSFPLFTEQRIVILKKFDALSTANKDYVIDLVGNLSDSVVFVAETAVDKLDTARMKTLKRLADEMGISFRFQHLSDDETIERVKTRLHREGFSVEPQALDVLVESVGTHLIDLVNEVEKIILSSEEGSVISKETVASVVGKYRTENLFSFLDQLGRKDHADLIRKLHRILDGGEEPVFVLAMLIRRILQLLHVRLLLDESGVAGRKIIEKMGGRVSPYQVTILLDQAKYFGREELETYLTNLRWADVKIKTSAAHPRSLIETSLVASGERKKLALYRN
ncbi:MAG: DNA polymerase III subunit delta [Candidatus Latescibacterota bacterium]|nr:MAG: DNA polymerase III subunit delta [Candidatus Latescibacterota bacterium]